MQIAAITVGDQSSPSSYYRIYQYLPLLNEQGIDVTCFRKEEITPNKLKRFDLIINQKSLIPHFPLEMPLLFDFDDAIWTRQGKPYSWITKWRVQRRLKGWIAQSRATLAANDFLAGYANKISKNVIQLPMALDLSRWHPAVEKKGAIRIGWSGHPVNLALLEPLEEPLKKLIEKHPHIEIAIHSGKRPNWSIPYSYVPFGSVDEVQFVQSLTAGLLPLKDCEFSLGKSPIKELQYLACGVPVVKCFHDLERFLFEPHDPEKLRSMVEENHCHKKVGLKLASIIEHYAQKEA